MLSSPTSPLPVLVGILAAYLLAGPLLRRFVFPAGSDRFATIDGLRGYLALSVAFHHACIWFFYLRSGKWTLPPSSLYTHLGQSSVALFFMITGFLFATKIWFSKSTDWLRLYVSRILRLAPLYFLAMTVLFAAVAYLSGFELHVEPAVLAKSVIKWMSFTTLGDPQLNGVSETHLVLAGVTWSLPYEWLFYLSLPFLSLLAGRRISILLALVAMTGIAGFTLKYSGMPHLLAFASGMTTALLVRSQRFVSLCKSASAEYMPALLIAAAILLFPSARDLRAVMLLGFAFALIAGGASLKGILLKPAARFLGELSYGIYLLHGAFLFLVYGLLIGKPLDPVIHWGVFLATVPFLLLTCAWLHSTVERPFMNRTDVVTRRLRSMSLRKAPA